MHTEEKRCISTLHLGTKMDLNSQLHAPAALYPANNPGFHWIRGYVDPKAGLDTFKKRKIPSPCQDSKPDRLARSLVSIPTALYRLPQ